MKTPMLQPSPVWGVNREQSSGGRPGFIPWEVNNNMIETTKNKSSMNDAVLTRTNEQIKHELASAYYYLAASAYFASENLPGAAKWMRKQSTEEVAHAMKLFDFVHDRGRRATLEQLDKPSADFTSPLDVFTRALRHEERVTALINGLYEVAVAEKDYPAQILLQWFITEQVEEERNAGDIVSQLKMVGDDKVGLLALDERLGKRGDE